MMREDCSALLAAHQRASSTRFPDSGDDNNMDTQVRTPQMVFLQPQRFVVPLFQRPYVWNKENQWEPLWNDIVRLTNRVLLRPGDKHHPHFLGAVVLQQVQMQTGQMQERTIIDGQQRLTTLQLFLDALHAELLSVGATTPALRIEPLVKNGVPFCQKPEDHFKVWPTNRDRPAFNAIMSATPPVDYDSLDQRRERMVLAHRYFSEQAREWLSLEGPEAVHQRAAAIETVVRDLLQMVVIDLAVDENAQEIFETLNARGAQLTAADLIKNFVFQRLLETDANVEDAYERYWKEFENGFWETEISVGRLRYPRSAIFLNHWLMARTGEEIVAREVFQRFKRFVNDYEAGPMDDLLKQVHAAADIYQSFIVHAEAKSGPIERLGLFGYRTSVLESEVIKPLILYLLDANDVSISKTQLEKALTVMESWMVRRMLVRATTKNYNQVIAEIIGLLKKSDRSKAGDVIEKYLASQTSGSRYWPDDKEIQAELGGLAAYRRLRRGRLRMVLEAVEDHLRGWQGDAQGLGGERVARGKFAIEHVMPRKWQAHWTLADGISEDDREGVIHTIGNLTLLTGKLNSKVSNGPWIGDGGKREGLQRHDVLVLNRRLLEGSEIAWTEDQVRRRSQQLANIIVAIWPVPADHRSGFISDRVGPRKKIELSDLMVGGFLEPGMQLFPRRLKHREKVVILLPDGRVDLNGVAYASLFEAATAIAGRRTNGWWFFLVDAASKRSLRDVRDEYISSVAVDAEEDDGDDDDDDDEAETEAKL
jgi:hypothetical protein